MKELESFVAFKSTFDRPGEISACLEWIEQQFLRDVSGLARTKGAVENSPFLILTHPEPLMTWFAHIDVVPGEARQFALQMEGNRVIGRGVKDMKGGALSFLHAYLLVRNSGVLPPVNILLTSDEETAGPTVETLLNDKLLGDSFAFTPDNGSIDQIVIQQKGMAWGILTATGRGGHGASPWDADNPSKKLYQALNRLGEEFPPGNEEDWRITVEVTRFFGETIPPTSHIATEASCALDIRFPSELSHDDVMTEIEGCLEPDCKLEIVKKGAAVQTDPDHWLVKTIGDIALEVTGSRISTGREHGTSDARFFSSRGVPSAIYGPIGGGHHTSNEWLSIKSLLHHVEINYMLLRRLCKIELQKKIGARNLCGLL